MAVPLGCPFRRATLRLRLLLSTGNVGPMSGLSRNNYPGKDLAGIEVFGRP